jgi:flavin reductase (DIM6/NTAB) family NADH-FMN oxidoreductase RutF
MEINPQDTAANLFYKVIIGSVVPRPIAWVSTRNEAGQPNLAPFSFFTMVCPRPPTLLFCPGVRGTDGGDKDTFVNVQASGEFVVNLVSEELTGPMVRTATELPPEVNEFEYAGLTVEESAVISSPRVAESQVSFECKLSEIIPVGDGERGSGFVVLGEVVHIRTQEGVLDENYRTNMDVLKPVARLSGPNYAGLGPLLKHAREASQIDGDK